MNTTITDIPNTTGHAASKHNSGVWSYGQQGRIWQLPNPPWLWRFDWACAGKRTIPRGWRDDSGVWLGVTQKMTPRLLLWQRPGFQHIYEVTHNCLELQL